MEGFKNPIDLDLWLDSDLIRRQNLIKSQFLSIIEEVGNSFSTEELKALSPNSRGVKISKGNDLLGFPYQVLDLIRDFDLANGVNIRLLNWIGNGFFVTVLLGKNRQNHSDSLFDMGFSLGLSESQWDYPDLILNNNTTRQKEKIQGRDYEFFHWIMKPEVHQDPNIFIHHLNKTVKKILEILKLPEE